MNLIARATSPTPKFFKVLRNIGIALATAGGAILAAPIALPTVVVTIGGYLEDCSSCSNRCSGQFYSFHYSQTPVQVQKEKECYISIEQR